MSRIVELHDHGPLVVKKAEIEGDATFVCRCGLSMQWPLCDGTHKKTRDETSGAVFLYTRDASGEIHRTEATAPRPGEADPRKGRSVQVPTPGTEGEAQDRSGEAEPA